MLTVLYALTKEAFTALWANRLRSFLTILGVVMGVTSVIAIVASMEGLQTSIDRIFFSMGSNTFYVSRFGFNLDWNQYQQMLKRKKLTRGLIPIIEAGCPDCDEVGAEAYESDHVKYGSRRMRYVEIRGETPNLLSMRNLDITEGRYFNWEDDHRRRQVAFIGQTVKERLFRGEDPLGRKIKVGGQEFTIVGVAEKLDGPLVQGMDEFVAIPLATHQKLYRQPGNPVNLIISAVSLERRQQAIDQVRVILRSARQVPYEADDDFNIFTPDAILSFINDVTRAYRIIMISLPLLSIIIGGIVIMNIMMISVTERTREIGIRKSIGARKNYILVQFLYESLILSLLGGLCGIGLGYTIGRYILTSLLEINISPTWLAITLGFGISTSVGLFFGIYPAMKAARLDPIKALSYE
ncbi:MAG: ABC transporter permease [candidate division Zixibacteria bacterium]|nr:ABC transporter permease [candidate division Zixibacteria bacterium]